VIIPLQQKALLWPSREPRNQTLLDF